MKRKSVSPSANTRGSVATNVTTAAVELDTSADSGYEVEDINININDYRAPSKSRSPSQVTRKTLLEEEEKENKDNTQDDSNQPINLWKKPAFTPLLPPIEECPPECPNKSLIPKCSKCFQPLRRPIGRCNCKQELPTCESSCQHYPAMVSKSVFPCNEFSTQTCNSPVCRPTPYDSPNCRNTQTFPPPEFFAGFDNSCCPSAPIAPTKKHKCVQTRGQDDFSVNFDANGPGMGMKRDCCVSTSDNVPKTCTFGTNYQDFDYNVKPDVENSCCKCTNFPEPIDQISLVSGRESRRATTFKEDDKSQISRRTTFIEDPSTLSVLQSEEKESQCSTHCRFLVPTKYICKDCGREHEPAKSALDSQPACNCGVGPDSPILSPKCNFCEVPSVPLKCNCGMQKGNNPLSQQCSCGIESQQQPSTPQLQPQSPQLQPQQQLLYPALSTIQPNFTQQPPMMNNQSFFPGTFKSFASQNVAQPCFQNKYTAYEPPKYFIVNQFSCTYSSDENKIDEVEPSECSCGDYDIKCSKDCCTYALRTPPYFTDNPITVDQSTSIGILNNTQEEQSFRFFHFEYNVNKSENSCYCSDNIKCSSNCIRNRTNKSTQFGKLLRLNIDKCSCDESVKCSAECIKYQDKNPITFQHKSNQYSLPTAALNNDNFENSKLNTLLNNIVSNLKDNSFKTTSNSILKCTKHKYNREFDLRSSNLESIEEESMSYELAPENTSSAHQLLRSANDFNNNTKSIKQPKTCNKQFDIEKCYCKDTTKCTSKCVRNRMQLNKNCNTPEKVEQYKCSNRSKLESILAANSLDKNSQESPNKAITKQLFEHKQFDPTKYIPKCDSYVYRTNLPTCYHAETSFDFNDSPEGSYCDNDAYLNCQMDCDIQRCCSFCNHLNFSHNSNQCCIEDNPYEFDENANYSCCPECDNVSDNAQYFPSQQAELFCSPECDIYTQNQASPDAKDYDTPQNICKKCFKFTDTCDEDTARLNNSKYRTNSTEPIKTQTNSENELIRICRECCERNKNVIDTALKKERQEEVGGMRSRTSFEYESCSVVAKENGSPGRGDVCPNVKFCDKNPLDISESEMEILISSYVPQSKQEKTSRTSPKHAIGNFGEPKYHYLMTDSSTEKPYSFEKPESALTVNVARKESSRVSKTSKIARSSKTNATKIALEANKRLVLDEQQKNAPVINRKLSPPYEDDDSRSDDNFPYKEDEIDDDDDRSILMQEDSTIKKGEINRKNIPSLFEGVVKERRKTISLQPDVLATSQPNKKEKKSHKWFKCFKKDKKNKETLSVDHSEQFTEIKGSKKRDISESDQLLGKIADNDDEKNTDGLNYRRRASPIKKPISEKDKVLNRYLDNLSTAHEGQKK